MMTPAQCRAARALLQLSQQELADEARVGVVTVRQFELSTAAPRNATIQAILRVFENAGVQMIGDDGVRFMRVTWRRTQDGDLPPMGVLVMINYTIGRFQTQPATFDHLERKWHLPSANMELAENQVPQWSVGPWDYDENLKTALAIDVKR